MMVTEPADAEFSVGDGPYYSIAPGVYIYQNFTLPSAEVLSYSVAVLNNTPNVDVVLFDRANYNIFAYSNDAYQYISAGTVLDTNGAEKIVNLDAGSYALVIYPVANEKTDVYLVSNYGLSPVSPVTKYSSSMSSFGTVTLGPNEYAYEKLTASHDKVFEMSITPSDKSNYLDRAMVLDQRNFDLWKVWMNDYSPSAVSYAYFNQQGNYTAYLDVLAGVTGTEYVVFYNPSSATKSVTFSYSVGNAPAIGTPTNLIASPGDGQVSLSWTSPEGKSQSLIHYYIVYQNGVDVAHVYGTSTTIKGLTNGQTYNFTVASYGFTGPSQQSQVVSSIPAVADASQGGSTIGGSSSTMTLVVLGILILVAVVIVAFLVVKRKPGRPGHSPPGQMKQPDYLGGSDYQAPVPPTPSTSQNDPSVHPMAPPPSAYQQSTPAQGTNTGVQSTQSPRPSIHDQQASAEAIVGISESGTLTDAVSNEPKIGTQSPVVRNFCPECGAKLTQIMTFCPHCGKKL